jgi:hypothetical protein
MRNRAHRRKLSTTVAAETEAYLESLVESGTVTTIAEAVDLAVARARRSEMRAKLERDTAAYFARLSDMALAEERELTAAMGEAAGEVDYDG